ncbi:hypothetical protein G5I_06141 [Acromyrmex echinatior]|uniref:DUF4817 domain-containing protein n=1 Tax=Acromyrmex echinatior TaxID=103372 RepID=F4WK89_ACREC|nr:hypothetical protein G5I_06141 [Acromyrmex echinatior]
MAVLTAQNVTILFFELGWPSPLIMAATKAGSKIRNLKQSKGTPSGGSSASDTEVGTSLIIPYRKTLCDGIYAVYPSLATGWAIYWYVFEFRRMATPNELQTRNFDSLLVIPSAARNNMFSLEERFEILKTYFQSQCCVAETVRILKRNMGRDRAPTEGAIRKLDAESNDPYLLLNDLEEAAFLTCELWPFLEDDAILSRTALKLFCCGMDESSMEVLVRFLEPRSRTTSIDMGDSHEFTETTFLGPPVVMLLTNDSKWSIETVLVSERVERKGRDLRVL